MAVRYGIINVVFIVQRSLLRMRSTTINQGITMKKWIKVLPIIFGLFFLNPAQATDIKNGKTLYDSKCNGCHDTKIHTRPNRIIHTYDDLVGRVKFCDNAAKSGFDDKQMMDVVDYLNDAFYKFVKD